MGPVVSLLICGGPKMDSSQDDADAARRPELPHPKKTMAAAERKVDTERIFMAESCCLFRESEIDLLSMDELCSLLLAWRHLESYLATGIGFNVHSLTFD